MFFFSIYKDQLIEVDVIDDSKAYSGFLTLRETFRKCSKVPSLSEKNLKVWFESVKKISYLEDLKILS
jgi:hypothetical protein